MRVRKVTKRALGRRGSLAALVVVIGLIIAACGGSDDEATEDLLPVVTSTPILADFARNVGGDAVLVQSLVPAGADPHSYQTTPRDMVAVGFAKLIILNGGGLDGSLESAVESAKRGDTDVIKASERIRMPLRVGTAPGERDPHYYLNPAGAAHYVAVIRDGLAAADPAQAERYRRNAEVYLQKLQQLDDEIERALEAVPDSRRTLVTFHRAFEHFGTRYGFRVVALVGADGGEPTPGSIAGILETIEADEIPAVFAEPQFAADVLEGLARDAGVAIETMRATLDADAPTYIDMMRANAQSLLRGLQ